MRKALINSASIFCSSKNSVKIFQCIKYPVKLNNNNNNKNPTPIPRELGWRGRGRGRGRDTFFLFTSQER
jgi:hypothetical protein